ncbi:MAG: carbohydrate ABC transporter substrate-binding protein [Chloroflexi bacterium]|nr:carbohydrate ABC transporter substrate-binding protein [Chloroflexota bacterium]
MNTNYSSTQKENRLVVMLGVIVVLSLILGACATPTPEKVVETAVVKETVEVPVEVTRVVEQPVEVTSTPAPAGDPFAMNCAPADFSGGPVTLSFVWWVGGGDSPSDKLFTDALDCFNKKYEGKIKAEVEYVPGQHDYVEKLKTDYAASGNLPIIVTLKRDPTLADLWLKNGEIIDLKPYFDASTEWKEIALQSSVELNTIDGQLVAAPDAWVTPVGIFYNTELFAQAGITQFPGSWEAFFDAMDQLKAAGVTPLSLHTEDTGWSAMLVFEALMARSADCKAFLDLKFPDDFNLPCMVDASRDTGRLFAYSTPDAIGSAYPLAANNFLSGKTAMMPNGPWMIGDFRDPSKSSPGFGDKIDVALYPGNIAVDDTGLQLGDWAITKGYSQAEQDAAAKFIEFMLSREVVRQRVIRLGSTAPNLAMTSEDLALLDPLAAKLLTLVQVNHAPVLPNYQGQWNTIIQNETIVQGLPQLALGNITAEEFVQQLTDAAKEGN